MESIKSLLTVPYRQENFKKFSINLLKNMESVPLQENKGIPSSFKNTIESYFVFGKYKDSENNNIIVLSVKVKDNSSAQKAQRQFVSYLLANDFIDYHAALVAYYDDVRKNWKLSFVTIEYSFGEKGVELKFKPAKRFSFLVGEDEPTMTYCQQLSPIYDSNERPTLTSLTEAFSVSRLSKDFYEDYKKKFFELYDYLVKNTVFVNEAKRIGYSKSEDVERFTTTFCKKTLGQIMFLHFVQKKGWLGVNSSWGDGDKQYLIHSTKTYLGDNYFNDFLEPLFYNALNSKRDNDIYLGKKVPFLNGGLFQPIENYDWANTNFLIPNDYWFNKNEDGLLNVLSQYNFTVDEADPEEQEVAIDPEMLGKIFESLLDTKDRSSLGAFYTPREIVHFMCEEALAARLSKVLDLDYDSILNYVRYGDALKETEFIEAFAEDIDEYVTKLTIVDPAVGSGAFLVGMLNQIVKLRTNLLQFTDKNIDKYEIKMEAIQNSLYGVDLEYDAVEIAKLRLWLSLIVDQETNGKMPRPLPNLNFHLRVGNSLVDTFEGIKLWNTRWKGSKKKAKSNDQLNLFNVETVATIMERLKNAKVKFFNTSDEKEKQKLAYQIETEQIELIRSELVAQGKFDIFFQIEEMLKKKTKPFFIWELEFEEVYENGGFDIVIANPPYVPLQENGGKLANELKDQGYQVFTRTGDIYCIFYEKATYLLKNQGLLCFITSNKWMRAGYGEKLRGFLSTETNPIKLIDFAGNKIFESATVDVNILIASKEKNEEKTVACTIEDDCTNNLSVYIKQNGGINVYTSNETWVINTGMDITILSKINAHGKKLSEWNFNINRGILTGYNDAFIIDETIKNALISSDPKSAELIRPILRGKDIREYSYNFAKKYIIAIPCGFTNKNAVGSPTNWFKTNYSSIYNYLVSTEEALSKNRKSKTKGLYKRDDQGEYWWELRSCKYMDDFYQQNIAWQRITKKNIFCLTEKNMVILDSMAFISHLGNNKYYLLGILNSNVIYYWINLNVPAYGSTGYRLANQFVVNMPIPVPNQKQFEQISEVVKEIVDSKVSEKSLHKNLQLLVYELYGLSEDEILYLEGQIKG